MVTFPAAVVIGDKVECILHIGKEALSRMDVAYCGTDRYSGYEVYADRLSGKMYAADAK